MAPRRADRSVLFAVIGATALASLMMAAGVYIFARYFQRSVTLEIPARGAAPEGAGIPLYPGAQRLQNEGSSVRLSTHDSLDKVAGFYREKLGEAFHETRTADEVRFESRADKRTVQVSRKNGMTRIALSSVNDVND